jgi:hypothetical protein
VIYQFRLVVQLHHGFVGHFYVYQEAGADYVGESDYVQKIQQGWFDFDVVVATPDMMHVRYQLFQHGIQLYQL